MAIRRMRFARWIPKDTNTLSEYVILIAFPLQQLLHEGSQCYLILSLPVLLYVDLIVIILLVHE
jgi:hypothetical protein